MKELGRMLAVSGLIAGMAASAGCAKNRACCPPPVSGYAPPPPAVFAPAPYGRASPPGPTFYQGPSAPSPSFYKGQPAQPAPSESIVAPPYERHQGNWQPAVPEPQDRARLLPPVQSDKLPEEPAAAEPRKGADLSDFPADIQNFHVITDRVATGLEPKAEGFAWLKNHGYRAALELRPPDEDNANLKSDVEKQGLAFLFLSVSPATLNRDTVDQFSQLIADPSHQPVFVFGRKSMAAGSLWYLHFRLVEKLPESEARQRAIRLGLAEDPSGEYADWWLAINRILAPGS